MAVLAVALYIGDTVARRAAERALAEVVVQRTGAGGKADVQIGGFLFVPPLLFGGKVESVRVTESPVAAGGLTFSSVQITANDVEIDRRSLLDAQRVQVRGLGTAQVTAVIDDAGLSAALHTRVAIHPSGAEVSVPGGGTVEVPVVLRGGRIVVPIGVGRELAVPVPTVPMLPCASSLTLGEGEARLTCVLSTVPEVLVRAAGGG